MPRFLWVLFYLVTHVIPGAACSRETVSLRCLKSTSSSRWNTSLCPPTDAHENSDGWSLLLSGKIRWMINVTLRNLKSKGLRLWPQLVDMSVSVCFPVCSADLFPLTSFLNQSSLLTWLQTLLLQKCHVLQQNICWWGPLKESDPLRDENKLFSSIFLPSQTFPTKQMPKKGTKSVWLLYLAPCISYTARVEDERCSSYPFFLKLTLEFRRRRKLVNRGLWSTTGTMRPCTWRPSQTGWPSSSPRSSRTPPTSFSAKSSWGNSKRVAKPQQQHPRSFLTTRNLQRILR